MEIGLVDTWYLLAGLVGASGNQVVYWGNRLRRPNIPINRRMIPVSGFYILTGGGVGFFVGVDTVSALLALGSGAAWPETLKALDAARKVASIAKDRLGGTDPSGSSSADLGA